MIHLTLCEDMGEGIIALIKYWVKKHVQPFVHLSHLKGMKTPGDGWVSAALRTWLVQLPHTCGTYSHFVDPILTLIVCALFKAFLSNVSQLVSGFMHCAAGPQTITCNCLCKWRKDSSEGLWALYLHWGRLGWFIHGHLSVPFFGV